MRTFEPRATFLFGNGFWAVTVPFGSTPGTLITTGTRPAARRATFASDAGWPRTSGTTVWPLETRSETVEPFATFVPAAGFSFRTTPGAACPGTVVTCDCKPTAFRRETAAAVLEPTTFGTCVSAAAETDTVTRDPRSSCVPAPGSCANTVPEGNLLGPGTSCGRSPRSSNRRTASLCFMPTTAGTLTADAELFLWWSLSRVRKYAASNPPITSSRSSRSQGQIWGNGGRRGGTYWSSSTIGRPAVSSSARVRLAGLRRRRIHCLPSRVGRARNADNQPLEGRKGVAPSPIKRA